MIKIFNIQVILFFLQISTSQSMRYPTVDVQYYNPYQYDSMDAEYINSRNGYRRKCKGRRRKQTCESEPRQEVCVCSYQSCNECYKPKEPCCEPMCQTCGTSTSAMVQQPQMLVPYAVPIVFKLVSTETTSATEKTTTTTTTEQSTTVKSTTTESTTTSDATRSTYKYPPREGDERAKLKQDNLLTSLLCPQQSCEDRVQDMLARLSDSRIENSRKYGAVDLRSGNMRNPIMMVRPTVPHYRTFRVVATNNRFATKPSGGLLNRRMNNYGKPGRAPHFGIVPIPDDLAGDILTRLGGESAFDRFDRNKK